MGIKSRLTALRTSVLSTVLSLQLLFWLFVVLIFGGFIFEATPKGSKKVVPGLNLGVTSNGAWESSYGTRD